MKISRVGGVIAAANIEASRPLLKVGSISVIRRIIITYKQCGVFPIVAVINKESEVEMKKHLSALGIIFLINNDKNPELMSSVRLGLSYLYNKCCCAVFAPVNFPMFSPATLNALIVSDSKISVPSCHGKSGHPVVVKNEAIPEILAYKGMNGLRGALKRCSHLRSLIVTDDSGVLCHIKNEKELAERVKFHNSSIFRAAADIRLEQETVCFNERTELLLYLIADTENMRTASSLCGTANSMAWNMINALEHSLGYKIVERNHGGCSGGGTRLTEQGVIFLNKFREFKESVRININKTFYEKFICTKIVPS